MFDNQQTTWLSVAVIGWWGCFNELNGVVDQFVEIGSMKEMRSLLKYV